MTGRAVCAAVTMAVCVAGVVLGTAGPAAAAPTESIPSYQVALDLRGDGTLAVQETIRYDFGTEQRHGIFRKVPDRYRYDRTRDRLYPIDGITATVDGGPVQTQDYDDGGYRVIRLGDPDATVTGSHTYVLRYQVRGAVNHVADHEELYWNAVGSEWPVPIDALTVAVTGTAPVQRAGCFAGPPDSRASCAAHDTAGTSATFRQPSLPSGAALTVVVAYPPDSVAHAGPVLVDRHDLAAAFALTPATVGGGIGLAVLGVGLALWAGWRARDRRFTGTLPGLIPGVGEPSTVERKPLFGRPPVSVEFVPPDDVRPGQAAALIRERAEAHHVTATIVDLAVRGHLHIRELRRPGEDRPHDWELTHRRKADGSFRPYERTLFRELFDGRQQVRLSELRGHLATRYRRVRTELVAELVTQGWYDRDPVQARATARARAAIALVATMVATVVLAMTTQLAPLGVGLFAGAVAWVAVAGHVPPRTARGSAMLERVQGLRLYIATAEVDQIRFAERAQIFSRYLPYAIAFGLAGHWAGVFRGHLDADDARLGWYTGAWGEAGFAPTFDGFTGLAVGSVGATPASAAGASGFAAGGFADGGGGGGGGGSW